MSKTAAFEQQVGNYGRNYFGFNLQSAAGQLEKQNGAL
jgi:hypothetical protein